MKNKNQKYLFKYILEKYSFFKTYLGHFRKLTKIYDILVFLGSGATLIKVHIWN